MWCNNYRDKRAGAQIPVMEITQPDSGTDFYAVRHCWISNSNAPTRAIRMAGLRTQFLRSERSVLSSGNRIGSGAPPLARVPSVQDGISALAVVSAAATTLARRGRASTERPALAATPGTSGVHPNRSRLGAKPLSWYSDPARAAPPNGALDPSAQAARAAGPLQLALPGRHPTRSQAGLRLYRLGGRTATLVGQLVCRQHTD